MSVNFLCLYTDKSEKSFKPFCGEKGIIETIKTAIVEIFFSSTSAGDFEALISGDIYHIPIDI